jgi:Tol biopolymer transport system component
MPDLKQRLDAVDQLPVDDLWAEIRERFEDGAAGLVSPVRLDERRRRPEVGWRKALTIAAVFALLAAVGFAVVRSLTSESIPADPPVEPTPAPLSGAIAYDLRGHIHVAGLDGSNPVALDDVVALDDECPGAVWTNIPSWSPDGRYLAFRRSAECGDRTRRDVVIADLQGNVVGVFPAPKLGYEIAWSPDSTRVAVWDEYGWRDVTYTIGVHGIDGSEAQFEMPPGWAPSWSGGPIWTADGDSVIVSELEVPLDGGTPREIPFHGTFLDRSGGGWQGALAYSPDGSQMAYGTPQGLMIARADGSDPRLVSDDGAHTAVWSPNGELIAVASNGEGLGNIANEKNYTGESLTEQSPNRLRVVDVATGSTTLLSEGAWFEVIGFSPDGDRVLYGEQRDVVGQPGTAVSSIWSIGVDGSDPRQIVVGTYRGFLRPAGPGGGDQR